MSKVTPLGEAQVTASDSIVIELVENHEQPSAVICRWPARPSVIDAKQFGPVATALTTAFAGATVRLAQIRRERRL